MAVKITEKWSNRGKGDQSGDTDITEIGTTVWTVTGVNSEDAALAAVDAVTGFAIPSLNDPYAVGSTLLCRSRFARPDGVGAYEVTAQYQTPANGSWTNQSPLSQPAVYQWQSVVETIPFDRDINGKPIVNSAGDPPSTPLTKTIVHHVVKITKYKEYYDYGTLKAYENTVNSAAFTLPMPNGNSITVAAKTAKCLTVEPSPYKSTDKYVQITATLDIYEIQDGVSTTDPHQCRFMDAGRNGFWSDGSSETFTGFIATQGGDPVTDDVRLDGTGVPLDASKYKIRSGDDLEDPVANPTPVDWCTVESPTGGKAVYLVKSIGPDVRNVISPVTSVPNENSAPASLMFNVTAQS